MGRKVYNTVVDYYDSDVEKDGIHWKAIAPAIFDKLSEFDYVKAVPYQIKKIAVKDCYQAFVNGCRKARETGEAFDLKFKSRKNPKQTVYIPKKAVTGEGIYHTIAGKLRYSEYDWLSKEYGDCRLTRENDRWFLIVPVKEEVVYNGFENQGGIVALDPGVRTFMTYFSSDGRFGLIGFHACTTIFRKLKQLDGLISHRDRARNDKDKQTVAVLNRKIKRLKWKVHDLVDELHWKTINYLVKNYRLIYLPTYETSEMTVKSSRKLNSKVVRNMLSFRNFEFGERLKHKCEECGVTLVRCNEAYTSKTNSFTGEIMNIGSREWFRHDGVRINRDVNGARNILLRAMRDDSAMA